METVPQKELSSSVSKLHRAVLWLKGIAKWKFLRNEQKVKRNKMHSSKRCLVNKTVSTSCLPGLTLYASNRHPSAHNSLRGRISSWTLLAHAASFIDDVGVFTPGWCGVGPPPLCAQGSLPSVHRGHWGAGNWTQACCMHLEIFEAVTSAWSNSGILKSEILSS